jgi:hypothetical protein
MMKQEPRNFDETPYPRLGEVVHFVVHAFGLFGGGDDLRKRLKRFASESDFNLVTANQLIDEALLKPLKKVDAKFAGDMREWLTKLLDDYKTIVLAIPTETANCDVVLAVLARSFFIPSITIFLKNFQKQGLNSPNLEPWFKSTDTIAVKEVLSWRLQTDEMSAEEVLINSLNAHSTKNNDYEDHKESIFRQLRRWKSGETLPDVASLLNLKQIKQKGKPQNDLTQLVIWLLLARAWQYICQSLVKRLGEKTLASFVSLVGDTYQKALEEFKTEEFKVKPESVRLTLLETLNLLDEVEDLSDHFLQDGFMPAISLESEKTAGDETQAQTILKNFEQYERYPHYRYFSELGWARYYAMHCDYKQALEHYQAAFKHGAYRAGKSLYSILRELLTLAAFLGKKEVINRHYRWACAMGLFSENHNQAANWEIKQFKMAFFKQFPLYGLYQCVDQQKKTEMEQEQKKAYFQTTALIENHTKWANTPPDLRKPDRKVKDFGIQPFPQLMIFLELNQNDKVKLLLEKGADPNSRLSDNGTTLLLALQSNNTEAAKLLLQHPDFKKETINARTQRKKYTALQWAIDKGYVDIIRLLIEKGADIEQPCYITGLSSLYYTLAQYNHIKKSKTMGFSSVPKENQPPDHSRRRSEYLNVSLRGDVFEQDFPDCQALAMQMWRDEPQRFKAITEEAEQQLQFNMDFSAHLQIIDVLLEAGADMNKRHLHGFTPFLYSAELGDLEIFRRLYKAGGNLTDCLDKGGNILSIALTYSNFNIAAYILEHGNQEQLRQIINVQNDSKGFTTLFHFLIQFKELKKAGCYSEETMASWRLNVWDKLLALEPDLTPKDHNGLTAEEFADQLAMPSFALELHKLRKSA